jgi:hypothetical protein
VRTGSVYALCTPSGEPFYVGATTQSVGTRVGQHLRDARRGRKGSEVHQLLAASGRVGIWVLQRDVPFRNLRAAERDQVAAVRAAGFTLLNYLGGGNGRNRHSDGARRRIATFARKRARGPKGQFLPILPAIAGGEMTPGERFWATPAPD